jgi:leucyl/phenylalanyl-tRNA--protein transferase
VAIVEFPPVQQAREDGLLAIGGDLEVSSLLLAYSNGIFPWPISEDYPLAWFSPDPRGVLLFDELHIPRSLQKFMKKNSYEVKINENFTDVIRECADVKNRKGQTDTWITEEMVQAYETLFLAGHAYCLEIHQEDSLIAGIYGVHIGHFVAGESMFTKKDNYSKVALVELIQYLHSKSVSYLDTQMTTSVVESLGGREIPRSDYMSLLSHSLQRDLNFKSLFPNPYQ